MSTSSFLFHLCWSNLENPFEPFAPGAFRTFYTPPFELGRIEFPRGSKEKSMVAAYSAQRIPLKFRQSTPQWRTHVPSSNMAYFFTWSSFSSFLSLCCTWPPCWIIWCTWEKGGGTEIRFVDYQELFRSEAL